MKSSPKFLPVVNVMQGLLRHLEDRAVLRAKAAALWERTKKISDFFVWRNTFSLVVLKNLSVRASLHREVLEASPLGCSPEWRYIII